MSFALKIAERLHRRIVRNRRIEVLTSHLASRLPQGSRVLDVGCGDGQIARLLLEGRPDLEITGIDVMVRSDTALEIAAFDGRHIPFPDMSFDIALFVDVLHHTEDPAALMAEALRVAREGLVIKDHLREGFLAGPTLRLMDWVGNHYEGVVLPYNYLSESEWREAWTRLGVEPVEWRDRLGLNAAPLSWFFDRRLHFVTRLERIQALGTPPAREAHG